MVTPAAGITYAGFWARAVALIADTLLLYALYAVLVSAGSARSGFLPEELQDGTVVGSGLLASIVPIIVSAGYFVILNGRGATVGKRLTGIRVVDRAGNAPGLSRSAIRYLIPLFVTLLSLGASLMTAFVVDSIADAFDSISIVFVTAFAGLLIVLVDGLSMLWSKRRQAFHDRMADTFVIQRASEASFDGSSPTAINASLAPLPSRLARGGIVAGLLVGFALCAGLAILGYRGVEWGLATLGDGVVMSMTDTLRATASDVVDAQAGDSDAIHFREGDVTVSNALEPGYVGWETTGTGTDVYGVELSIDSDGIALGFGDGGVIYSGMPIVIDGSIEITEIRGDGSAFGDVMDETDFERIIESGLNDALAEHGLVPTDVVLRDGHLMVKVAPAPGSHEA